MDAPGDCSPSRKVVSKMINLSAISILLLIQKHPKLKKENTKEKGP